MVMKRSFLEKPSPLTIGTTAISGGTNRRVLFDDNGVVGEAQYLLWDKTLRRTTVGNFTDFFTTDDTHLIVGDTMTSVGSSLSPFDLLKLGSVTNFVFQPSADTNSGLGLTLYAAAGTHASARGTHNFNGGLPLGSDVNVNSVVGGFGAMDYNATSGSIDGGTGILFTASHGGYGGTATRLTGCVIDCNTTDDAGNGTPTGSALTLTGGYFITGASGVSVTTMISGHFKEPYAFDQLTGAGVPTITNRIAGYMDGTMGIARSDVATGASLTNVAIESSHLNFTGSTATAWHGLHADTFSKVAIHRNSSSAAVTIKYESGTESTAANRFANPNAADLTVPAGGNGMAIYDTSASRWVPILPHYTGQTYSASNVSTDRSYDANSTTVDELADVLGTLIADLRSVGVVK